MIVKGDYFLPLSNDIVLKGKDTGDASGDGRYQGRLLHDRANSTDTLHGDRNGNEWQ